MDCWRKVGGSEQNITITVAFRVNPLDLGLFLAAIPETHVYPAASANTHMRHGTQIRAVTM